MTMIVVGSIVIRVGNLERQRAFRTAALDYVIREPQDDDFAMLQARDGRGPNVSLDVMPSDRTLPPRIHLDLYAEDQPAEIARISGLSASEVHWDGRPTDADYVIMEDPEGNRFCVIDATGWRGFTR